MDFLSRTRAFFAGAAAQDDVGFVGARVEHAIDARGVDPGRVYVAGVSRGGCLTYRLLAAIPHKFAAFAALLPGMAPPAHGRPPAAALAGLPDAPQVDAIPQRDPRAPTRATRYAWGEPEGTRVVLYRIDGAGHAEPGRLKRHPGLFDSLPGRQNADLEAAEVVWDFFRTKRIAQLDASRTDQTSIEGA